MEELDFGTSESEPKEEGGMEKAKALYEQLEDILEPMGKSVSEFCQEMDKEDAKEDAAEGESEGDSDEGEPSEDKGAKKALIIAMLKKKQGANASAD